MSNEAVQQMLEQAVSAHNSQDMAAAEKLYQQILDQEPQHGDSLHNLGLLHIQQNNVNKGIEYLEKCVKAVDNNSLYWQSLGTAYRNQQQNDKAKDALEKAIKLDDRNHLAMSNLVMLLDTMGQQKDAIKVGQNCLNAKDKLFCDAFKNFENKPRLNVKTHPGNYQEGQLNIIAFDLPDNDPERLQGAIINASIAPYIYPEWQCRFYCSDAVPKDVIGQLVKLGAEVSMVKDDAKTIPSSLWRCFASDDSNVTRFICRDPRSRLNVQEKNAVDEWVASNKYFHVMRDNINHVEVMRTNMWGGVAGVIANLGALLLAFYQQVNISSTDPSFLRGIIWPLIKDNSFTHDSYYQLGFSKPFPEYGRRPAITHVGSLEGWDISRWK
ncbi:MAG: UDP-N-acetylglucosamine-peptide N-acetylglucosaminyltransferase [Legionellales bacterium]|nr:UDP-N-acetylglucosamine-peptide N-acetylglucosaminyltransferase [Legionellales bacterium]|tara:strand:+ start:11371 stop:12516 length:1146 start_codon:yes stop_codon:yes gene_type:complete